MEGSGASAVDWSVDFNRDKRENFFGMVWNKWIM